MIIAVIALILLGAYWAGPMPRDDGWPEPVVRQRLADKKAHASRTDPGIDG